jgi:hypothetical protein
LYTLGAPEAKQARAPFFAARGRQPPPGKSNKATRETHDSSPTDEDTRQPGKGKTNGRSPSPDRRVFVQVFGPLEAQVIAVPTVLRCNGEPAEGHNERSELEKERGDHSCIAVSIAA